MAFKLRATTHLLPHQEIGVAFILEKKCSGLFDRPGVGKSLQIIAAICSVGKKALIVCPPFLANMWHTEITKFSELEVGKDVDIVPYTMLGKRVSSFEEYGLVAADEAHYLKNLDAQRTRKFHGYMGEHLPAYFIWATGTPIKNRIPEIYSFLLLLARYKHVSPNILVRYKSYYSFCMRFCNVSEKRFGGRSVMQFSGMKNTEELKEYLKPWTIRRDVEDLPEMENQTVIANYKEDTELAKAFAAFTSGDLGIDMAVKRQSAVAKAHFTAEYANLQLEAEMGPLVIFSDHRDPVSIITRELSAKWRVASIMGGDSMKVRDDLVKQFQNGQLDALVITIGSGSTGITLTKSNLVIFNDVPFVVADLEQARKRIHRISQDRDCRCIYIAGSKADESIIRALRSKMRVIKEVVDGR